jgi:hypothetical protein
MSLMTKVSGVPLDVKLLGDDGVIEGYGSVFGNVDSYGEMVMPGAFEAGLAKAAKDGRSIKMLWQHDSDRPIGVWDDLREDKKGLRVKGRVLVNASGQAREAFELIKAGALEGLSIGYRVVKAGEHPTKPNVIALHLLDLMEVSPVTFAANDKARVDSVKHLLAAGDVPTVRQFEELLREAGFSKTLAAAIATKAAPHLRGDPASGVSTADFIKRLHEGLKLG